MIDIEVIDNFRYGVLENGGKAHKLLKAVNSAMMLARLSSEDGVMVPLPHKDLKAALIRAGLPTDDHSLETLYDYGMLIKSSELIYNPVTYQQEFKVSWKVTPEGQDALKDLKEGVDEIFMPMGRSQ